MMDVTVKTLDGQNRNYSVPENITVKQFKEKIANSINISAEIQRLIFQGRVMQDEKHMKDYDVHGKVIHVVQRMPPSSTPRPGGGATNAATPPTGGATGEQNLHSTLIGSFINLPSDVADPNQVHDDGSSVDVHIHLGQVPGARQSESQLRINQARRMLQMARENLDKLDRLGNPPAEEEQQQTERGQGSSDSPMDVSESNQQQSTQQTNHTNTSEPCQSQTPVRSETPSQPEAPTPSQPEAQTPPTTRPEPPTTSASNNSQSNPSTENSSSQSTNGSSSDTPRRGPVRPNISIVADVLEEVREVNNRLQPHMDTYQRIVREDRQLPAEETREAQEVCNMVGEILHAISHCYHSLSDLMVDMGEQSPRQLYAAFVPAAIPAAVIQQTIPIHAQINVGGPQAAQRNMATQSSVQTSSAATSTSQASSHAASQTPSTQASGQSTGTATTTPAPGATPVVARASTDPYVFLEVGPDNAVTVNSITAHVISSEQEVPNTSGPSTGSTNTAPQGVHVHGHNVTQDLINNIVSSVMHAHTGPRIGPVLGLDPNSLRLRRRSFPSSSATTAQTGSQTTSQSSNSSGTQTSSATSGPSNTSGTQTSNAPTNTSGTQTGMRAPHTAAFVVPGMPGMMQRIPTAGPASVDPFLPCSSRHFLRHQARNNNNTPEAQGVNTGGIIGEFLNNLAGEVNPHLHGVPHPNTGRTATSTSASGAATNQTATSSSSSSSSSTTSTSSTGTGSMPFNPFAGLFGALGGAPPPGINIRMPAGMAGMTGMPGMQGMPPGMPFLPGLASMFGQAGPRPAAGGNQNTTSSSTTSASSTGSGQTTSAPTTGSEPAFVQQLRNLLQTGMGSMPQPAPGTSSTGATPTPPAPPAPTTQGTSQGTSQGTGTGATPGTETSPNSSTGQPVMTDEAFTQLVQGIGSMITQTAVGQPPSQTLSEFLGSLGDGYNMAQGEGFFNDVYSCLSSHLTFPDLIQVFYGNRAPLQNVRVPLQEFLRERVLEGREPTMENITEASSRLVEEMSEEIEACANVAEVKPDIDLVETLNNFFRQQFTATVRMIMLADESNTNFGNQFYERMRMSLAELIVLTRSCLVEGQTALQRIIQSRLSAITRGVNPMIQQWMCNVITQQLNQFLPTITITDANVHSYIVKKNTKKQASNTAKKDEAATAMETSPPLVSPGASQVDSPEPMETQNINTGASVAQPPRPQPATAAATKVPATKIKTEAPKADSPGAAAGGESWELEVNPDWVPIINSDIEKQKHQRPQPAFSDTYLQGMPAKRRKIMGHEGQVNFSNAEESVPLSLRRAVAAAGVQPISSMENMTSEASDNHELQHAFDEQVLSSIRDRLNSDSDYRPEQFPNTDRYYHKNNKK
ncbi:large proline-rich protein BAG6-like isoform X2 [Pecten maximus]|uniref:large proline-rich protein BAG6-like isoform X2 n=1 Tax=Pecten maximus TaxID=6579 RepID=UPI0014591B56|nr:large proline-rich protein BAG6-like isoform X2 [Pecten maximus]